MIQAKILGFVLEHLFRKSKRMKKILDYVNEPNKNDIAIEKLQKEVEKLKKTKADKNKVA
tara:strand:- start:174 stop:353 length:180 start_codon:yes stop_codon:yes gene_type:complete